ncbi:MAG: hypothetical protein DRP62_04620 [Planctomycetota bacterium]|nr:MAG: hypothetical protein DRP62_04620 [Planctomycetota bacterium]
MDLLIIGDHHGDIENTLTYLEKLAELKFDVIVYSGDFTDVNTPKGFTQEDIAELIIEELKTLKKPIVAVPGNTDTSEIVKILEREKISIHGKGKVIKGVGFYGYGGAKTPFGTPLEPSEEELKSGLEKAWKDIINTKQKIQVTHSPPYGTRLDVVQAGAHVGSRVVEEFIKSHKPIVAVSGHVLEARGTDKLGTTFLINAGKFPEGYFGLVNIQNNIVSGNVLNLIG